MYHLLSYLISSDSPFLVFQTTDLGLDMIGWLFYNGMYLFTSKKTYLWTVAVAEFFAVRENIFGTLIKIYINIITLITSP